MANTSLYPPTIPNSIPAAPKLDSSFKTSFPVTLSKFSTAFANDIKGYHLSIKDKITGRSIVNLKDAEGDDPDYDPLARYRRSGVIMVNENPFKTTNTADIYFYDDDVFTNEEEGFTIGGIYQIQIRLSLKEFDTEQLDKQMKWLSENAQYFSEWSTVCTFKVVGRHEITFSYNNSEFKENDFLEVQGVYNNEDSTETLNSYKLILRNGGKTYETEEIKTNKYTGTNVFKYKFKQPLKRGAATLDLYFTTKNLSTVTRADVISVSSPGEEKITSYELDTVNTEIFNEEGCNIIKLKENATGVEVAELYRKERGQVEWEKLYTWSTVLSEPYLDKTIESGKEYFYATVENGDDSLRFINKTSATRYLDYSYLIGDEGQQLKLMLENTMNNFSYNIIEQKTDTIGGQYAVITRNGNVKYRTFPVNGMISFEMDNFGLFAKKFEYASDNEVYAEKLFRDKVIEFLYDGKPKLFRSPTEGNIIIRLSNVAFQPNQALGRKIYTFTATAYEIADNTVKNYEKFGFLNNVAADGAYIHHDSN